MALNRDQLRQLNTKIKDHNELIKRGGWKWKEWDMENKKRGYKPVDRENFIERMNKSGDDKKQSKEELEDTLCQLRALKTLRERLLK